MLRKVFIVLDFNNDNQVNEVQKELNEFSNSRAVNGRQIMAMLPMFRRHKPALLELFGMIAKGGIKSVLSIRGAQLINSIRK